MLVSHPSPECKANWDTEIVNRSLRNVSQLKYVGMTVTTFDSGGN
jgi:hypothetical protein